MAALAEHAGAQWQMTKIMAEFACWLRMGLKHFKSLFGNGRKARRNSCKLHVVCYNEAVDSLPINCVIHYGSLDIMRTTGFWSIVTLTAAIFAAPAAVHAQSEQADPRANTPPPPQTMTLEEGEAPAVTITPPNTEKKITEKKSQGRVTEVKVQTGRTTYYAHPNDTPGAMRGDVQSSTTQPVQFEIGRFGPPYEHPRAAEPVDTLAPAPAPPPAE